VALNHLWFELSLIYYNSVLNWLLLQIGLLLA
jgi:hypothetical protein